MNEKVDIITSKEEKGSGVRLLVVYLFSAILFGVLLINLINLQIVKGNENLFLSSTIKTSEGIIRAPRGLIYDSEGKPLVVNQPSFKLVINLSDFSQDKEKSRIFKIAEILNVEGSNLWKDYRKRVYEDKARRTDLSQITLLNDIERNKIVSFYASGEKIPGVFVEIGTIREYKDSNTFAHVLGYVSEVSAGDLEGGDYDIGDIIGSVGIEKQYDDILRGINGRSRSEIDRDEQRVRDLIPVSAKPGDSIQLSINSKFQKQITKSLKTAIKKHNAPGGAAVLMDISNGEILSLVSLPTYDNNRIVKGLTTIESQKLRDDDRRPLYNRAVSMAQPPGSTFKTIVASAALEENAISKDTVFESTGCMELAEGYDFCEAGKRVLGKLNLPLGIARSSNIYFCNTMLRLGVDTLNKYTKSFGLSKMTGIDLPSETGGIVASRKLKKKTWGEPWYDGDSCNAGIGQGDSKVTPIQMVAWISAIANGGTYHKPHIATAIIDQDGKIVEKFKIDNPKKVAVSSENLSVVREGMHLAVQDSQGSGFSLRGLSSDPAVKTGSAEAIRGKPAHSWVTGFFPYEEPRFAFVVYLEYGGWGYHSAEVMKDFLSWYETRYQS